jgi:hypothetical protein
LTHRIIPDVAERIDAILKLQSETREGMEAVRSQLVELNDKFKVNIQLQ